MRRLPLDSVHFAFLDNDKLLSQCIFDFPLHYRITIAFPLIRRCSVLFLRKHAILRINITAEKKENTITLDVIRASLLKKILLRSHSPRSNFIVANYNISRQGKQRIHGATTRRAGFPALVVCKLTSQLKAIGKSERREPFSRRPLMRRVLQPVVAQPSSVLMLATERVTPGAISRTGGRVGR